MTKCPAVTNNLSRSLRAMDMEDLHMNHMNNADV